MAAEPGRAASTPGAAAWRRRAGQVLGLLPLTGRGLLLAAAAAAGYALVARAHMDVVLWVTCLAGLGLAAFAVLATTLAAITVRLRWPRADETSPGAAEPPQARAGLPWRSGFVGPGVGWLPLLRVRWAWLGPPESTVSLARRGARLAEEVTFHQRWPLATRRRRVVVEDVFGLARVSWEAGQRRELQVLPAPVRADLTTLRHRVSGDGVSHPLGRAVGDRVDLRAYQPGDPVRHLLWKVFARNRRLVVRTPERALVPARRTLAYLVHGEDDEATAGLALQALQAGALGSSWRFGADGSPEPTEELGPAVAAIVGSAAAGPASAAHLDAFLERASEGVAQPLVLFIPPTPGTWLPGVLATLRRRRLQATVVIGARRTRAALERPRWQRWLLRPAGDGGTPWEVLRELLSDLHAAGQHGVVVDSISGRVLGLAQLRAAGGSA